MPRGIPATEASFWARTVRNGPCLEWLADRSRRYGRVYFGGKAWIPSRLAWTLRHGPIPQGLYVCHTCDHPWCVETLHMFLGTAHDNSQDFVAKGLSVAQGRSGAANSQAKLTAAQVEAIRATYAAGGVSHRDLAARFGVTHQSIGRLIRRQRWA